MNNKNDNDNANSNNQGDNLTANTSTCSDSTETITPLQNATQQNPPTRLPPEYVEIVNANNAERTFPSTVQINVVRNPEVRIQITAPSGPSNVIQGPPPLEGAPPSYSAIMRIGPPDTRARRTVRIQPSPPFIAPRPPPSYAETEGIYSRNFLRRSVLDEYVWSTEPIRLVCPSCSRMITTRIYTHRSNLTHFSALVLCMCGCWPCCLIPYCIKSCKTTHHYCPDCDSYLGMYTPW